MKKYCPDCWPQKRKNHLILHIEYYLNKLMAKITPQFITNKSPEHYYKSLRLWYAILELLSVFKISHFEKNPNIKKLFNRSLIFWDEAQKRNLDLSTIRIGQIYLNEFKLNYQNKTYYFAGIPTALLEQSHLDFSDKQTCNNFLAEKNIPVPNSKLFHKINPAIQYGLKLKFPLVIKPNTGSLSQHVYCPIQTKTAFYNALKAVRRYKPDFLVQEYILGKMYRATVIGQKEIFICQKEKPQVTGDGHSTIRQLIKLKNTHPQRGQTNQKNTTLHQIPLNSSVLKSNLNKHNLTLDSVPLKDQPVILLDKYILSCGCDIINCKAKCHSDNIDLFQKISQILNTELIGIDFICPDISKSWQKQLCGVVEVNSLPYLDMHQYPSHGQAEPVAKIVWEYVLEKLNFKET